MADCKHNPFESPTCSIAEAILWVAYRDVARIRDEPSLFSLQQWPDAVTKGHWLLLRELARERRRIVSFDCTFSAPFKPAYYRDAWSNLKDAEVAIGRVTLRFDEKRARQILGLEGMEVVHFGTRTFRDFIRRVESVLGFIYIDTDSLTEVFPTSSEPAALQPVSNERPVEPAAPPHGSREEDTSLVTMISDAYYGGARNEDEAYDVVRKRAQKAGFHVPRGHFDAARKDLGVRGSAGRPRKETGRPST